MTYILTFVDADGTQRGSLRFNARNRAYLALAGVLNEEAERAADFQSKHDMLEMLVASLPSEVTDDRLQRLEASQELIDDLYATITGAVQFVEEQFTNPDSDDTFAINVGEKYFTLERTDEVAPEINTVGTETAGGWRVHLKGGPDESGNPGGELVAFHDTRKEAFDFVGMTLVEAAQVLKFAEMDEDSQGFLGAAQVLEVAYEETEGAFSGVTPRDGAYSIDPVLAAEESS